MIQDIKAGFTHGGVFHADDVFSTALLRILNPDIQITRGFHVPKDFEGIVYDIGMGRFDHHQKNKRVRDNGVAYAAFGLLWDAYGRTILEEGDAKRFDEEFVQPLDYSDNTGSPNVLSQIIADMNLTWKETKESSEEAFWNAVEVAHRILQRRFAQILAEREAFQIVRAQAEECVGQILYLEKVVPWKDAVKGLDIMYVIYASNRGGYNIQAVPCDEDAGRLKSAFPEQWRGEDTQRLFDITGISGFQFCHMSGFLCVADTLTQAQKIANLALQEITQ